MTANATLYATTDFPCAYDPLRDRKLPRLVKAGIKAWGAAEKS
jgi:hypothetical protein